MAPIIEQVMNDLRNYLGCLSLYTYVLGTTLARFTTSPSLCQTSDADVQTFMPTIYVLSTAARRIRV